MLFDKETINRLKDVGLNSYEARLWVALLSRGVSTAGELSDIADVPRSRSYDVLESLEKKGFIIMKLGKPIKYIAVHPNEVLNRVKQKVQRDADDQFKVLDTMKASSFLGELDLLYNQGIHHVEPIDMTGVVKGRPNVHNHLSYMIKNAKKSVHLSTTEAGALRKSKALKSAFRKAKENGAKIKILAPFEKSNAAAATEMKQYGLLKSLEGNEVRLCIVDGKEVFMPLMLDSNVHPSYDAGVWINTPYVARNLSGRFDHLWSQAKKF